MRRRLLLTCSCLSLVACASILGDFDVAPAGATADAGGADANVADANDGSAGDVDAGPQPTAVALATSLYATCATVKYPSTKLVTYCWGELGIDKNGLGVTAQDLPLGAGFYRPRLPQAAPIIYPAFDTLVGGATGDWFMGRGTTAVNAPADYAWGDNVNGECAVDKTGTETNAPSSSLPNELRNVNGTVNSTNLFATPGVGCILEAVSGVANPALYCWGHNDFCEVTAGQVPNCYQPYPDKAVRALFDESTTDVGSLVVDQIVGGPEHMCAARRVAGLDGIYCWGDNERGQCGQGAPPTSGGGGAKTFYDTPTLVVGVTGGGAKPGTFTLASGDDHVCYLDNDSGELTCWGYNDNGEVNPAASGGTLGPTKVPIPTDLATGGKFSGLTLGGELTCLIYNPDAGKPAKAYCWGFGPRGNPDSTGNISEVESIQDVSKLAVGRYQACAIARSNNATASEKPGVWCWGTNPELQTNPAGSPTDIYQTPTQIEFPPEPAD